MTVRWITVTLGTKRPDNSFGAAKVNHSSSQAGDVTLAWDDSVVTTKDHLNQGVRLLLTQALGTLSS